MSFVSPLYSSRFEHDACGIGAVVDIRGRKSHGTVDSALKIGRASCRERVSASV